MKDKPDYDDGKKVHRFTLGDPEKALEITLNYDQLGACRIKCKKHWWNEEQYFECVGSKRLEPIFEGDKI